MAAWPIFWMWRENDGVHCINFVDTRLRFVIILFYSGRTLQMIFFVNAVWKTGSTYSPTYVSFSQFVWISEMPSSSMEKFKRNSLGSRPESRSIPSSAERVGRKRQVEQLSSDDEFDEAEESPEVATPSRSKRRRTMEESPSRDRDHNERKQIFESPSPPRSVTRPQQRLSADRSSRTNILDDFQMPNPSTRKVKTRAKPGRATPDKKSAVLNIILNHMFWTVSRKPSTIQLVTLHNILQSAHDKGLLHDNVELPTIRAWFRSKRFFIRKSLKEYLHPSVDPDAKGYKLFAALARCFGTPNLTVEHDIEIDLETAAPSRHNSRTATHRASDLDYEEEEDDNE